MCYQGTFEKEWPRVVLEQMVAFLPKVMLKESCCGLKAGRVGAFTPEKLANATQ